MSQANYTDSFPNVEEIKAILHAVVANGTGFTLLPIEATANADGTCTLSTGGGGGSGNTVAATNAGTSATTANPVQGVTNGVPLPTTGTLKDGASSNLATISAFHSADNQQPGGTAYGLLTGGVAQLLNPIGNLDRQTEASTDGITQRGIATGAQQMASPFATTSTTTITVSATTATITVATASGTNRGSAWSIQVGATLYLDTTSDPAYVTAVSGTSITLAFQSGGAKAHSGTYAVKGYVYNQARDASIPDGSLGQGIGASATELFNTTSNSNAGGWEAERSAAGELDGASGTGTAVAAGYEYNGGAAANTNNFDRERNVQGKGFGSTTLSATATSGATSVALTAVTGLYPGAPIYFEYNGGNQEVVYVSQTYTPGTLTVALQSATTITHNSGATAAWDIYASGGPGLNGILPTGIGIEEDVVYNAADGKFYLERSATADAVAGANLPIESLGLYNGSTFDRARSDATGKLQTSLYGKNSTAGDTAISVTAAGGVNTQSGGARARTNRSSTIATGGTAQSVFTAGQATNGFYFQNLSSYPMYLRQDGTAATATTGLYLAPNAFIQTGDTDGAPTTLISVYCATTGAAYYCETF